MQDFDRNNLFEDIVSNTLDGYGSGHYMKLEFSATGTVRCVT